MSELDLAVLEQAAHEAGGGRWFSTGWTVGSRGFEVGDLKSRDRICSDVTERCAEFIAAANPAAISELLNRLKAAESSAAWHQRRWMALQMHQTKMREPERTMVCDIIANGELMHPTVAGDRYAVKKNAGGNEMIDIDALKRDKRPQSAWVVHALIDRLEEAEKERDALREQMERQEPARLVTPTAYRWRCRGSVMWQYGELTEETVRLAKEHNREVQSLYALPGAQSAPSVPDDIVREVLRDCCGTFHGSRHRITCEKYKGKKAPETKP